MRSVPTVAKHTCALRGDAISNSVAGVSVLTGVEQTAPQFADSSKGGIPHRYKNTAESISLSHKFRGLWPSNRGLRLKRY
jgi:hypothetical protein